MSTKKASWLGYLSLPGIVIPVVGIPFAIVLLIYGFRHFRGWGWPLVLASSLALSGQLYFANDMFNTINTLAKGASKDDDPKFAQSVDSVFANSLADLVGSIEVYYVQHGHYPSQLDQSLLDALPERTDNLTKESDSGVSINKGYSSKVQFSTSVRGDLFYMLNEAGNAYYLFLTGPDKIPFTADDILPNIEDGDQRAQGYDPRPLDEKHEQNDPVI